MLDFPWLWLDPGEDEVVEELVRAVGLLDARAESLVAAARPAAGGGAVVGWPDGEASPLLWLSSPALSGVRGGDVARLPGAAIGLPFGELLIAPCLWRDELTGIVCVVDKETRAGQVAFDDEDERFLRSLALLAAPAIAAGRQLEQAERHRLVLEEENRALRLGSGEDVWSVSSGVSPVIEVSSGRRERRHGAGPRRVGTGKEQVTSCCGLSAPRGPFVPSAVRRFKTLLEAGCLASEGVATGVGAYRQVQANGGTLFLDEVGDRAAPAGQAAPGGQGGRLEAGWGRQHVQVDVRLVAHATATSSDDGRGRVPEVSTIVWSSAGHRRCAAAGDIRSAACFVRLHGQRLGQGDYPCRVRHSSCSGSDSRATSGSSRTSSRRLWCWQMGRTSSAPTSSWRSAGAQVALRPWPGERWTTSCVPTSSPRSSSAEDPGARRRGSSVSTGRRCTECS